MSYQLEWSDDNLRVEVAAAYEPNKFVMRSTPFTEEEKIAYRKKREEQTPQQNLRDLMRDSFLSSWKASELAKWMEVNCPGYYVRELQARGNVSFDSPRDVLIEFANLDHAMLFKLTWA